MKLCDLISKLQEIQDKFGECYVQVANDKDDVLDAYDINRVCFFKDEETQIAIIVEE